MNKVLILAAHPDDEVLGCGGVMSKYLKSGADLKVVFLGEGSSCRYQDPSCAESLEAIRIRKISAISAIESLGVKSYSFYDLPCGRFDVVPIIEINKIIEAEIEEFSPTAVFTHSSRDVNNDHQLIHKATLMSTRPGAQNSVRRVLSYEVLSSSEWSFGNAFLPNFFERLKEEDVVRKWRALAIYATEVRAYPFPRSNEGIRAHAMMRGMQAGFEFAEAFQLIRELNP